MGKNNIITPSSSDCFTYKGSIITEAFSRVNTWTIAQQVHSVNDTQIFIKKFLIQAYKQEPIVTGR